MPNAIAFGLAYIGSNAAAALGASVAAQAVIASFAASVLAPAVIGIGLSVGPGGRFAPEPPEAISLDTPYGGSQ